MARKKRSTANKGILAAIAVLGFVAGAAMVLLLSRYTGVLVPSEIKAPPPVAVVTEPPPEAAPVLPPVLPGPAVAIVIDDLGQDMAALRELVGIDAPLTMAVLPNLSHSVESAFEAHSAGREVIMHLPMEPEDMAAHDPGAGVLLTSMTETEIKAVIEENFRSVPYAIGVNNHMGSRFTADPERMRTVIEEIRERGMFFLDSRTTNRSAGFRLAGDLGVRKAGRAVFLDNNRDVEYIKGQLMKSVRIAKKRGTAVAIGHPYPETIRALSEAVPTLASEGVVVVSLSRVVK